MIDLSLMKAIRVDPSPRTVKAAGGVLWGELDRATQLNGWGRNASHPSRGSAGSIRR